MSDHGLIYGHTAKEWGAQDWERWETPNREEGLVQFYIEAWARIWEEQWDAKEQRHLDAKSRV